MLTSKDILSKFKLTQESTMSRMSDDDGTGRNAVKTFYTYSSEDSVLMKKVFDDNGITTFGSQRYILSILGIKVGVYYNSSDKNIRLFHTTFDTTKDRDKLEKMPLKILEAVNAKPSAVESELDECAKYAYELALKTLKVKILYRTYDDSIMSTISHPVKLPRGWYKKLKAVIEKDSKLSTVYFDDTYQKICVKYKNCKMSLSKVKFDGLTLLVQKA